MARKEITTPLDLKNMDNHNYNYDELYGLIDETDRRISEDMWEEIKDANTMKMLEPVQTAAELPTEAPDKSLITVIDEQRVYTYFQGKWQPFNEIDLDPFEPFKEELAAIVAAYEEQIKNITTEVQNTKASAIDSVQSTQTQSEASITQTKQSAIDSINQTQTDTESNINQTKQSAINSINQTQTEVESQISTIRDEMTTQASDLTALFNDHMAQLTSKQDTALAEVESAKQAAITALEDFNNTDTSNWQKYKLTEDNGAFKSLEVGTDMLSLKAGNYESSGFVNDPLDDAGYYEVTVTESYNQRKVIHAIHSYSNRYFVKTIHTDGVSNGWKELTGMTRTVLFEGQAKTTGELINLITSYENFTELKVLINRAGGNEIFNFDAENGGTIPINHTNLFNSSIGYSLNEMLISRNSPTELEIYSQAYSDSTGTATDDSGITILKIWGIT